MRPLPLHGHLALAALVLAGCAGRRPAPAAPAGPAVLTVSQVDMPPQLVACPGYVPPVNDAMARSRVAVEYVVDAEGAVVPGTVRVLPRRNWVRSGSTANAAVQAALNCRYEPGTRSGQAVPVRLTRTFLYTS